MRFRTGLLLVVAVSVMAFAQAANAKTFRYATTGDILGLDPHSNNEGPTNTMKGNIYGRLIHRKPDLSLEPDLAVKWEKLDEVTWRFHLRKGVTFHNGNPFTADDVLFSFERQNHPEADMRFVLNTVEKAVKIDDHTVDLITKGPDPILLLNMPNFYIMDQEWTIENNAANVVRGAAQTNFPNTHANGTGPFRLIEWVPDTRIVLEPFENWWGNDTKTHNVTKAVFTPISNDATRVAALLSGEIDLMYPVPLQDVKRVNANPATRVIEGPELRTIFLGFDQWRDELLDMPGSGKNPFKDARVRKAFYQAIDIQAIKRVVMRGASRPTALMVAPGINGHMDDLDVRFPHDPEASKKLLADAGYGDGFPVTFDCPNDRYVNDEEICLSIVPMLERIGIKVTLNAQTKSLHFNKINLKSGNDTSFYLLGWTPGSYDSLNPLMQLMTLSSQVSERGSDGHGDWNAGQYHNDRVAELTEMLKTEMDDTRRNAMIREAFQIHKDEVGHIPLHQQALAWGIADTVKEVWQRPFNDVDLRYVNLK